jgi:hypothetical protein
MRIEIARLYARTRRDGATTLSGRIGYDGRLRVEPNPNHDPTNEKSPAFLAFIESAEPKAAAPYTGVQLMAQVARQPQRGGHELVEGEIVE